MLRRCRGSPNQCVAIIPLSVISTARSVTYHRRELKTVTPNDRGRPSAEMDRPKVTTGLPTTRELSDDPYTETVIRDFRSYREVTLFAC